MRILLRICRITCLLCGGLALPYLALPLSGQSELVLAGTEDFSHELSVTRRITLGSDFGEVFLPPAPFVVQRGTGYLVGPTYDGELAALSSDGRLEHTIGQQGEGPGEFPGSLLALRAAASGPAHALNLGRLTRIATTDLDAVDQVRLDPPPQAIIPMRDGRLIALPPLSMLAQLGPRAAVIDRNGETERTIALPGDPAVGRDRQAMMGVTRVLAPSGDSAVWSAPLTEYVLDLVGLDGTDRLRIERRVDWFSGPSLPPSDPWLQRPEPYLSQVREDTDGRIWVLLRVATQDWVPGESMLSQFDGAMGAASLDFSGVFDTIVEVLDPHRGEVVAHRRLDGVLRFVDGPEVLLARTVSDDYGVPSLQILETELVENAPR